MAVQAPYLGHAFPHDSRASIRSVALDNAKVSPGAPAAGHLLAATALVMCGNTMFSEPTCDSGSFVPRKRARVGDAGTRLILEGNAQSRVLCSGATSTSGRPSSAAPAAHGLLSHLYRHDVEINAFTRDVNEWLRAGLEEARRRHVRTVVSAVQRVASQRLHDAESELERVVARNAKLGEKLRQIGAEGQAWLGVAQRHEAIAAGLRSTLDQLLQSPPHACGAAQDEGEGDAEDAQSCCFQREEGDHDRARSTRACKSCDEADACVLLLQCRHLCLCSGCEAAVEACPVCAVTKNASLHVLLSS